jgi:hypothetical protein
VSARLEGVRDGAVVLEHLRRGALARAERAGFFAAAGDVVGRLHAARFLHVDLTPHNLLFGPDGRAWVIDLDRGRFVRELAPGARQGNLRRLYRAVRRRERRGRTFLSRCDYLRFLRAYGRAAGEPDWRADWRAIVRRDALHAPWHRLAWWVEEALGAGPATRDGAATDPR